RRAPRRTRLLLAADRCLRADRDRFDLVLGPAVVAAPGPGADDGDGRRGRPYPPAEVRTERADRAVQVTRARGAPDRDARLSLGWSSPAGRRHRRGAGAGIPGGGRPVPRA